jgi:hypothetical protein
MRNADDVASKLLGAPFEALDERARRVALHVAERRHIARNLAAEFETVVPATVQPAAAAPAALAR